MLKYKIYNSFDGKCLEDWKEISLNGSYNFFQSYDYLKGISFKNLNNIYLSVWAAKPGPKDYERRISGSSPVINPLLIFHPKTENILGVRSPRMRNPGERSLSNSGTPLVCSNWIGGPARMMSLENDFIETGSGSFSGPRSRSSYRERPYCSSVG